MQLIITLFKIFNFHTNLNLGFVDALCSALALLTCLLYTTKIKQKQFSKITVTAGLIFASSLIIFMINPSREFLILYLILRFSMLIIVNLISDYTLSNISNKKEIKNDFKAEYFFSIDAIYAISRSFGYFILFGVCVLFGMEYINYVLILCILGILGEIFVSKQLNSNEI